MKLMADKKREMAHKMGSTMGAHAGTSHDGYEMHGGHKKHPHAIHGHHVGTTHGTSYTMNAVTPSSKSRGERYSGQGGKINQPHHTMNASKPGGTTGERATQAGKGMESTKGERATQANKKGNFSSVYTQHGKGK